MARLTKTDLIGVIKQLRDAYKGNYKDFLIIEAALLDLQEEFKEQLIAEKAQESGEK